MGLDVYVMPIWRFKAGDFATALEGWGMLPTIRVTPGGMFQRDSDKPPGIFTRWKAKRARRCLQREIEAEIGHPVSWNDDGDVAYTQQSGGFESLRAFAKWLDYRDMLPTFDLPPEGNYYNHPVVSAEPPRPLTYPQIVEHSCYSGYYIPTDLERIVYVEPYSSWGGVMFKHSVGSSIRLLKELGQLSGVLGITTEYEWQETDPLNEVKASFAQLYEVAKISVATNLPIVFYG